MVDVCSTDEKYELTLKGIVFIALGGFEGEEKDLHAIENTDRVCDDIGDYLNEHNCVIVPIGNGVEIVDVEKIKVMSYAKDVGFDTDKIDKRIKYLKRAKTVWGRLVNRFVSRDKSTKTDIIVTLFLAFGVPAIMWLLICFF